MKKVTIAAAVFLIGWSMGCAVAQQAPTVSGNPIINLDVRDAPSSGADGYTDVTACGTQYSYRYSGGGGKGGDVTFTSRGKVTVVIKLNNDSNAGRRYTINDISFKNDANGQLSWVSNAPANGVIHDKNDKLQAASYKVTVNDATADCDVPCDPMIINR
ncbi:MAG: hypothetical protein KGJ55_08195 [Gammaproteobacteria bacterium]|nr:hypothetical protein [Gammaproteobacteria bacterium]